MDIPSLRMKRYIDGELQLDTFLQRILNVLCFKEERIYLAVSPFVENGYLGDCAILVVQSLDEKITVSFKNTKGYQKIHMDQNGYLRFRLRFDHKNKSYNPKYSGTMFQLRFRLFWKISNKRLIEIGNQIIRALLKSTKNKGSSFHTSILYEETPLEYTITSRQCPEFYDCIQKIPSKEVQISQEVCQNVSVAELDDKNDNSQNQQKEFAAYSTVPYPGSENDSRIGSNGKRKSFSRQGSKKKVQNDIKKPRRKLRQTDVEASSTNTQTNDRKEAEALRRKLSVSANLSPLCLPPPPLSFMFLEQFQNSPITNNLEFEQFSIGNSIPIAATIL